MGTRCRRKPLLIAVLVCVSFLGTLLYLPSGDDTFFKARRTIRNGNSRRISLKYDWNVKFRHKAKNNGSLSELLDASTSLVDENKREFIVDMTKFAWRNYRKYAWGHNELRPISLIGHSSNIFGKGKCGATIVDALDTLLIMGLKDEYDEAREWVDENLDLMKVSGQISVFETNIRFVGGLLAAFALTKDEMYVRKAAEIADLLLPAFNTPTGIPYAMIEPSTKSTGNWGWANGGCSILSEFGTLQLEFDYLTQLTNNSVYSEKVLRIRDLLFALDKTNGLYSNYLHPKTGKWGPMHVSVGALGDSFYEYLLKAWLRSNKKDTVYKKMYDDALMAIKRRLLRYSSPSNLAYFAELKGNRLEHKMDHLACFIAGMFALEAMNENNFTKKSSVLQLAEELGNTCHESYIRTATGIGPESFRFGSGNEAATTNDREKVYILRPEVIEGWFYLWRATKNVKYREWSWNAAQAINRHCRTPGGFSGIKDVYQEDVAYDDVQQSFLFAETLKYLYLTFSDDSVMPLDQWVFNTEAHAFPITG